MGKLKSRRPRHGDSRIEATGREGEAEEFLVVSFKYFDDSHPKFPVAQSADRYLISFLVRLKHLCGRRAIELHLDGSTAVRWHPINWDETSEVNGFTQLPESLRQQRAYQFSVSQTEYGRVHGFLIDRTFFVVWLDRNHSLYP